MMMFFALLLTIFLSQSVIADDSSNKKKSDSGFGQGTGQATSAASSRPKSPKIENDMFSLRLYLQSPEQMAAFYEGRGFSKPARDLIRQTCYVTAIFVNKSNKVIWLDLKDWHFETAGGEIKRLDREYWAPKWDSIQLEQASRSTFGWTLLPEVRDIQPNESVGGNIALMATNEPFYAESLFCFWSG